MSSDAVTSARVASARSIDGLLRALMASDPGRPRLTWYGPGGERVELSAKVLANWVAKTGNLLVEQCEVEPGSRVWLDLPAHWRTVVLALAAWSVGAEIDEEDPDVVVTARPSIDDQGARVVAVALPALARRFERPDGGVVWDVDYAAEVAGFADEPVYAVDDDPGRALTAVRPGPASPVWPAGARVLVTASGWTGPGVAVRAMMLDGSVVIVGDPAADLDRLAETEQVTVRL